MECYQTLFLLLSILSVSLGQVSLYLGSMKITTNNTEIILTDIGEDAPGGRPSLTCHTDLPACCRNTDTSDGVATGQWYYPNGRIVQRNADAIAAGEPFYRVRNFKVVKLARRRSINSLRPSGSYCCVIPTTRGEITFCVNLVVCPPLTLTNGMISYSDPTLGMDSVATHTCDFGYDLHNTVNRRVCGSDGYWSGSTLICEEVCFDILSPSNGGIQYSGGLPDTRPVGTAAFYTCDATVRVCQPGNTWSGSAPDCPIVSCGSPSVYLSLSSTNYLSGLPDIPLSSVGEGRDSSLVCHTDLVTCCQHLDSGMGAWYYPNGSTVSSDQKGRSMYIAKGEMLISLNRKRNTTGSFEGGLYCCELPTIRGRESACINLVSLSEETDTVPQVDITCTAVVVGVATLLLAVIVALVLITYFVLRYRRSSGQQVNNNLPVENSSQNSVADNSSSQSSPPIERGQDSVAIFTTDGHYEVPLPPSTARVNGQFKYTPNKAYRTTMGCRNVTVVARL